MLGERSLIGRAEPLEAVTAALNAAADGVGPSTIVLTGLAGSGTSTVIRRRATDSASQRVVLVGIVEGADIRGFVED